MKRSDTPILGMKKSMFFRKHSLVVPRFAELGAAGEGGHARRLAYCKVEGRRRPGIIYLAGYFAPMNIAKANALEAFCLQNGHPFVKYDAEGVGQSALPDTEEISFTKWYEDACYVIEHLTDGPQMLVSSSNGAWMTLLMASRYPERIHSTALIGPAVNHCLDDDVYEAIVSSLDKEMADRVRAGKTIRFKANWVGEVTASKRFLEELKSFRITDDQLFNIRCPIRIVHATDDSSVRWDNATRLMSAIGHTDVRLYLKKRGDHRMLDDEDLYLQLSIVRELLDNYPVPDGPPPPPNHLAVTSQVLREGGVLQGDEGEERGSRSKL